MDQRFQFYRLGFVTFTVKLFQLYCGSKPALTVGQGNVRKNITNTVWLTPTVLGERLMRAKV